MGPGCAAETPVDLDATVARVRAVLEDLIAGPDIQPASALDVDAVSAVAIDDVVRDDALDACDLVRERAADNLDAVLSAAGEAVVGHRQLCGRPRVDFDLHPVAVGARHLTVAAHVYDREVAGGLSAGAPRPQQHENAAAVAIYVVAVGHEHGRQVAGAGGCACGSTRNRLQRPGEALGPHAVRAAGDGADTLDPAVAVDRDRADVVVAVSGRCDQVHALVALADDLTVGVDAHIAEVAVAAANGGDHRNAVEFALDARVAVDLDRGAAAARSVAADRDANVDALATVEEDATRFHSAVAVDRDHDVQVAGGPAVGSLDAARCSAGSGDAGVGQQAYLNAVEVAAAQFNVLVNVKADLAVHSTAQEVELDAVSSPAEQFVLADVR